MSTIKYSDGTVTLRGNASQTVRLADPGVSRVPWESTDKRACDVEIRVAFQQLPEIPPDALIFGAPFIRWTLQLGHGDTVIETNQASFPLMPGPRTAFGADVPRGLWSLMPGRGLLFRVTARDFTLSLQNTGYWGMGLTQRNLYGQYMEELGFPTMLSFPPAVLQVSFLPVVGLEVPVVPRYASVDPDPSSGGNQWGNYVQLPAAATELRVLSAQGNAIENPADPADLSRHIRFLDAVGYLAAEVAPETLYDWYPIPHGAWALQRLMGASSVPFNVEFR